MEVFHLLNYGVAIILTFIGVKMLGAKLFRDSNRICARLHRRGAGGLGGTQHHDASSRERGHGRIVPGLVSPSESRTP